MFHETDLNPIKNRLLLTFLIILYYPAFDGNKKNSARRHVGINRS